VKETVAKMNKLKRRERGRERRLLLRGVREAHRRGLDTRDVDIACAGSSEGVTEASFLVAETGDGETLCTFSTGVRFANRRSPEGAWA
jgi:hypothetical protein